MRKSIICTLAFACLLACVAGTLAAQSAAKLLDELNAILASSSFRGSILTLAADGTIGRKDRQSSDGRTMSFKLQDIDTITIDTPDAEANVILLCKDDKPCVRHTSRTGEAMEPWKTIVFSVHPADLGPRVAGLFKDLQAMSADTAKK
jgi:hypothetical protein